MYKIDSELTEGGKEDEGEKGEGGKASLTDLITPFFHWKEGKYE